MRHVHVVRPGDRLTDVAAYYGLTPEQIVEHNPHKPIKILQNVPVFVTLVVGEELALPPGLVYFSPR